MLAYEGCKSISFFRSFVVKTLASLFVKHDRVPSVQLNRPFRAPWVELSFHDISQNRNFATSVDIVPNSIISAIMPHRHDVAFFAALPVAPVAQR